MTGRSADKANLEQVPTRLVSIDQIIRSASFRIGVADVRAGKPPRFDEFADEWDYERGRQWAVAAPRAMPLMIGRKLNPEAITIYERAGIP